MTGKAKHVGRNKQLAAARLYLHGRDCQECDDAKAVEHARRWHGAARALVLAYVPDDPHMWRWVQYVHDELCPGSHRGLWGASRELREQHERDFADSEVVQELRRRLQEAVQ